MKEHFKEQLDAGPADGTSAQFIVFYLVESDSGMDMLRIANESIDNLDEKYVFSRHEGAIPILTAKE